MEFLSSCAASCATKIGEGLLKTTGRQFGYFINYKSYIEDLKKQLDRLISKKNELNISMEKKRREGETIRDEVRNWVEAVVKVEEEVLKFMEDEVQKSKKICFRGWFPDLITRYCLTKEARQKIKKVMELQKDGAFNIISIPAPPPEITEFWDCRDTRVYKTTEDVLTKAIEAIKDNNINFIGVHGMGGVGKTTLAKLILNRVGKDFDKVLMVVISQNDVRTIQGQLRDQLGVELLKEETELGRAHRLKTCLKNLNKVLLILDDVWEEHADFKAVGIPSGDDHKGCKVIITSRSERVCKNLGNEERWKPKLIPLRCLSDQESWVLFQTIAPDAIGNSKVSEVARGICRECGGLPLALVALGRALIGKDLDEWEMAAQELKKSASMNIPGVDDKVVNCLKLSYDKLKQQCAKDLFLLCCLFPEDSDILIEDLVLHGFGMEMFGNVGTIQEARRIAKSMIKYLQNVSLLLTGDKEGCLKMHDVVRDVAISIGSTKYLVRAGVHSSKWPNLKQVKNYIGMSLMKTGIDEPHPLLECPTLQILLLGDNPIGRKVYNTRLFERMEVLKVLDMRSTGYWKGEYPSGEQLGIFNVFVSQVGDLKCLTTLILDGNQFMDTSFLGEIKTLEVLSLKYCKFHEKEIKGLSLLTKLRYLDISHSFSRISSNAISSLSKLEELYLLCTQTTTEPKVESILNSFPSLGVLTISIEAFEKPWPQDIIFPDLEAFVVSIIPFRSFWYLLWRRSRRRSPFVPNTLNVVDHEMFDGLEKLVRKLSKRTNNLFVEWSRGTKNIIPNLLSFDDDGGGRETSQLETIYIWRCDDFEYLIDNSKLEKKLHDPLLLFANLGLLSLYWCLNLKTIFEYSSVAQTSLMNLKELRVESCPLLEEIIESQDEEESEIINVQQQQQHDKIIVFHRLKSIKLCSLGSLKAFCLLRNVRFEFPLLEHVSVKKCPNMKTFSRGTLSTPKLKEIKLNEAVIQPNFMDLNMLIQNQLKEKENRTIDDEDEDEDEDDDGDKRE